MMEFYLTGSNLVKVKSVKIGLILYKYLFQYDLGNFLTILLGKLYKKFFNLSEKTTFLM